ncbi:GNAT family N-acetyltransferase [Candidatus Bipolaricaulota bacterium]|nr:GNAT family N-acetyltransferase [Candidatus Bipolaricaulota bacterium]
MAHARGPQKSSEYRSKGIGTKLLNVILEFTKGEGLKRVRLHVVGSNIRAKVL